MEEERPKPSPQELIESGSGSILNFHEFIAQLIPDYFESLDLRKFYFARTIWLDPHTQILFCQKRAQFLREKAQETQDPSYEARACGWDKMAETINKNSQKIS
jgi:hypothetical protein